MMELVPNIDYGEVKFPISGWGMLVATGLMSAEKAAELSNEWLSNGGMKQFECSDDCPYHCSPDFMCGGRRQCSS